MSEATKRISAVWSYSVYGGDTNAYYAPIVNNIILARQEKAIVAISTTIHYEGKVREFFRDYLDEIQIVSYDHAALCAYPKILRFLIPNVLKSNFYFFKDSDSIVTAKEVRIMREWMSIATPFAMFIRDHPLHVAPIMAGMFGISSDVADFLTNAADRAFLAEVPQFNDPYSYDQDWLRADVYPELVERAYVYTSFLFYSAENVRRIDRESQGSAFIGAQAHYKYPVLLERTEFYDWYGAGLLCAPSLIENTPLYGRVRPTLMLAFFYTIARTIFGRYSKNRKQDETQL